MTFLPPEGPQRNPRVSVQPLYPVQLIATTAHGPAAIAKGLFVGRFDSDDLAAHGQLRMTLAGGTRYRGGQALLPPFNLSYN